MRFQQDEDFVGEQRQILGDRARVRWRVAVRGMRATMLAIERVELDPVGGPLPCLRRVGTPSSMPVAIILAMSRRQSVMRSRTQRSARSSARTSSAQRLEFVGARDERREVEAKGIAMAPSLPLRA